ncbi:Uncharacterised protein [Mycobacterium tuberculosis]|uniref:Uncharacterized protein n=1 Tax=Mycobacterium tuberculosis TaxID=1773 RepID=A0A655ACR1_MYCTX|nr:PPE family protein PPE24 [Mycobacterium tuberculosis variant microti]CKM30294.1 Uncharacterised protein [Mycobacterium tuberculosis]CKS66936.1 Uncharacterised protein [Mycobacterium tuberculosis]CNU97212.1 Uncharacterised protein [Mycobacterium tuberculosis]CNW12175.1 Uncharacterised protein [Mycobacterium tuberculosis]
MVPWKKPARLVPILAKPETTLATENGRMPLLAKPETPLPRLEKPEDSPPKF